MPRPGLLDDRIRLFAGRHLQADRAEERFRRHVERLPLGAEAFARRFDALVEAGNFHLALGVVHVAEDRGQHADRVDRRAAVEAGMQVAVGAVDDDFGRCEPA
jgi:hypothetical protein